MRRSTVLGARRGLRALPAVLVLVTAVAGGTPALAAGHWCGGEAATIVGTPGDDRLVGTGGQDVIVGLGGNDVILGRDGWDHLCAGGGDDVVVAGPGNDLVHGGDGADRIFGEYRSAEANRDVPGCSVGSVGAAEYEPSSSSPQCGDSLVGGPGADRIAGGPHQDFLLGRGGDDVLLGQRGGDRFIGDNGTDRFDGGSGEDMVEYTLSSSGVTVDLAAGTATGEGHDAIADVEVVTGSNRSDRLYGDAGPNWLMGSEEDASHSGPDLIVGRGGEDYLEGQEGNDDVRGGRGRDFLIGGAGSQDRLNGGRNRDTCITGEMLRHCERTAAG